MQLAIALQMLKNFLQRFKPSNALLNHIQYYFEQKFEAMVRSDTRFEIPAARHLGMVVFRLKGDCAMTEKLLKKLNSR